MNTASEHDLSLVIRPVQYRDMDIIANLSVASEATNRDVEINELKQSLPSTRSGYGLLKLLNWFPNPLQHHFSIYVAEAIVSKLSSPQFLGFARVSPFNRSRTTWRVEQVCTRQQINPQGVVADPKEIGSQLLRYCFEKIWEARTWLLEVNVNEKDALALYRHNGFQPLAQMTYWSLSAEVLNQLAQQDLELPNLLPVSNADAQLLYQLDCVSMPPLLRQVFDRHPQDFKTHFLWSFVEKIQHWCHHTNTASGYVFEPQRKAAIGYFKLTLSQDGSSPHQATLTVHPAYTWLYPKLLIQMAKIVQTLPDQSLELVSSDYQHEREQYLEKLGAQRNEHTLLMSRSVWHKLKEAQSEGLHLSEVLQGLHPVPRTPIPSRTSWIHHPLKSSRSPENQSKNAEHSEQ